MTKYRIQELFDFQECKKYFLIQKTNLLNEWGYTDTPRYETLADAKAFVRIMKQYENRVFHYLEDEEEN